MMRKLFIAAILLQFLVLFFICGKREKIARWGDTVYLRTAPVDPRDLFRGDYVRLEYEISNVGPAFTRNIDTKKLRRGQVLYGVLKRHEGGLAELSYLTEEEPDGGIFIKGWYADPEYSSRESIGMKYGIEAYFVQQGRGLEMEAKMGRRWDNRDGAQTPMEVEVALGGDGTAVIRGHRWSPLAHAIDIGWKNDQRSRWREVIQVRFTMYNVSGKALALVNLPDYGSFTVEPQGFTGFTRNDRDRHWIPDPIVPSKRAPRDADVILLQPDQKRTFIFDFTDPKLYFKSRDGRRAPIGAVSGGNQRFRIIYRAPSVGECRMLGNSDMIWHGYLPSRAFTGSGYVD